MKRTTERALWIGGSAVAAAGAITTVALLTRKSTTSVTTPVTTTTTTATGPTTGGTQTPAPAIPAIPYTPGQAQTQLVSAPGGMYTARAIQGGTLTLTFTNSITSVSPDASYTSQVTNGNQVTFTLSGQTGTIIIKWGGGATQILVQYANLSVAQATNQ